MKEKRISGDLEVPSFPLPPAGEGLATSRTGGRDGDEREGARRAPRLSGLRPDFRGAYLRRQLVEDAVDEFVAVGAAEGLG